MNYESEIKKNCNLIIDIDDINFVCVLCWFFSGIGERARRHVRKYVPVVISYIFCPCHVSSIMIHVECDVTMHFAQFTSLISSKRNFVY